MDDLVQKILNTKTLTIGIILIAIGGIILYFSSPININKQATQSPTPPQDKAIRIAASKQASIPPRTATPCFNTKFYTDLNEALKDPTNVCHLNLANQKLSTLPDDFSNFTNLSELYLNQNSFTEIPDVVFKLQNLTRLDVTNNSLSSIPSTIGNLTNLQILTLTGNNISTVPTEVSRLSNLTDLLLAGNPIKSLPSGMSSLKYLKNITLPAKTFNNTTSIDKLQKDLPQTNIRFY